MTLRNLLFFVLCSLLLISCSQEKSELYSVQDNQVHRVNTKDKWIIINYWASWCANCIEEMPELNHFYQTNKGKNILVFGANFDRLTLNNLNQAIRNLGIFFPVLIDDPAQVWQLGAVDVLPTTFIINPKGKVVKKIIGPNTKGSLAKALSDLEGTRVTF